MPTENRSSNTEMVSVPRETIEQAEKLLQEDNRCTMAREFRTILAKPADQHQGEPVAYADPRSFENLKSFGRLGGIYLHEWMWAEPEPGMVPLYTRPAQGEPVGWQFCQDGKWWNGDDRIKDHRKNTEDAGCPVRDVFAHADPGEVERLRAALKFYADREHYHFESGDWDTVSGEPLNILWRGEEPDFIEDGTVARGALERQL